MIVFATLNTIDRDSDVTLPGAFGRQTVPMIPANDCDSVPIGKATIYETRSEAVADFALNLKTKAGRNWYEALKFDLDHPPIKQQYSYGFTSDISDYGEFDGKRVRFLRKVTVHSCSNS